MDNDQNPPTGHGSRVRLLRTNSVLRNRNFSLLWAGQSASMLGSGVTTVALPSLAVLGLDAGAAIVGALIALQWAPYIVLGPLAGVWADRIERRRLIIATDLLRMTALASVPIVGWLGALSLVHLLVAAGVVGVANVFFNVAYHSYLPSILPSDRLTDGNAKLEMSSSLANVLGPLIAGVLIAAFGSATALAVDAFSFFFSAATVFYIRTQKEQRPTPKAAGAVLDEIREGVATVIHNPYLIGVAGATTTGNLAFSIAGSVMLPYFYRDLELSPRTVGIALAVGGCTLALSSLSARWLSAHVGIGKIMLLGPIIAGAGYLVLPVAPHVALPLIVVFLSQVLLSLTRGANNVAIISIVQSTTPNRLLGRVNGVTLPFVFGFHAIGGLVGGALASSFGNATTLLVAGLVTFATTAWVLGTPIRSIGHELPSPMEERQGAT